MHAGDGAPVPIGMDSIVCLVGRSASDKVRASSEYRPANGLSGTLAFPLARTSRNLENVALTGDTLTFTWSDSDISYQFTVRQAGADLGGVVTQGEQQGDLTLMHLGELVPEELDSYTGLYAAADDTLIGLHTNGNQLWIRDFQTGRMGELRPLSDNRFILGVGFQVYHPVEAILTFTPDELDWD